jgi:hypothetical protein
MSTLWTPDGERPIRPSAPAGGSDRQPGGPPPGKPDDADDADDAPLSAEERKEQEEMAAQVQELRDQLARTPAGLVVANHAFGLFELAALHLSLDPPNLDDAQLAIDALGALVETMAGRLGEHEAQLKEGLAQLRIAYVQIKATHSPS